MRRTALRTMLARPISLPFRQLQLRHLHGRELRFLGLIALTALLAALHLAQDWALAGREGRGWRRIDLKALEGRIDAGKLSGHEASWYHESKGPQAGAPDRSDGGTP
jgi:hypothetical protein